MTTEAQPEYPPKAPTQSQKEYYEAAFPHLGNFSVIGNATNNYNCISWSLGFNDRWVDAGSREQMVTLYAHYYFVACPTAEAEVDVYDIADTPATKHIPGRPAVAPTAKNPRGKAEIPPKTIPNAAAVVMHAHRILNLSEDHCSSKQQAKELLQHGRHALEDAKPYTPGAETPVFGVIYGHFKKHDEHPSKPGKSGNTLPPNPGKPKPTDSGLPGTVPLGHPGHPDHPDHPHTPAPSVPLHHPQPASTLPKPTHPPTAHPPPHPETHATPHAIPHSSIKFVSRVALPTMKPFDPIPAPHPDAVVSVSNLHSQLGGAYPALVEQFNKLYAAWKATWHNDSKGLSAHSATRAEGPEFEGLLNLGPKIIPLIVNKLKSPDDFFAVQLYNALEEDENVKVDPKNLLDYNVLQRQANLIVDLNHQRNKGVERTVAAWKDHQERNALKSYSSVHTEGDAYDDLVNLGPSIIGNIMADYHKQQDGWHHELLHDILHGEKSGNTTHFKEYSFNSWKEWFENGEHEDAPKGV